MASIQDFDSFSFSTGSVIVGNLDIFDEISFSITSTPGSDTVSITSSKDGTNFGSAKILPTNETTAALAGSVDLPNGEYVALINCKSIKFTHSGSTDAFRVTWAARNAGRRRIA